VEAAVADLESFYLLGWSFSGPLALRLAAKDPQRTLGVILSASFIRPPLPFLPQIRFAIGLRMVTFIRHARRIPKFVPGRWSTQLKRDKAATLRRVPAEALVARIQAILTVDAQEALRACTAPILYLAGSHDRVVPRWNAEAIIQEQPAVQLVTITGPHLAMYTNPGAAAAAITDFIKLSPAINGRTTDL
jgi:pimeloyl-ACP methyl ester carboxylesterase